MAFAVAFVATVRVLLAVSRFLKSAPFKSQLTVFRKPLVVYIIESNIETLRFIDIHQQPEVKG